MQTETWQGGRDEEQRGGDMGGEQTGGRWRRWWLDRSRVNRRQEEGDGEKMGMKKTLSLRMWRAAETLGSLGAALVKIYPRLLEGRPKFHVIIFH